MAEKKESLLEKHGFVEEVEEEVNISSPGSDYYPTGYPEPAKRYRIVFESPTTTIEEPYYWILTHLKQDQAYPYIYKITDTLASSEGSSQFGVTVQRLNIQQDKAAQYLGTIANMVKSLFQIVREIRILKERLAHYKGSLEGRRSADIALKGYWADLVEGGGKNPASVYGLAQQLGFATLPDLFFRTTVPKGADVDKAVDEQAGEFNRKVKEVLRRKLAQFVEWRDNTQEELETRLTFTLRYLRQHWGTIRMYMNWVKPMLRNIKRLQNDERYRDDPELISGMDGSIMELEILARKSPVKGHAPVVLAHFEYRTRPHMNFNQEFQRGPIHVGRVNVTLRAYAWTEEEIEKYRKMREEEDFEMLGMVDESVAAAMDALGDELRKYLEEAGEEIGLPEYQKQDETPAERPKGPGLFDPFMSLFSGFKEAALFVLPERDKKAPKGDRKAAEKAAAGSMWQTYKNFKASHGMLKW